MVGIHVKPGKWGENRDFAKAIVSVGTHDEAPDDRAYWLSRSAEERIAGVEFLGRQFYSYASAEPELRRFLEVVERAGR